MPIELVAVVWLDSARATPLFTRVQERLDALNQVMQENLAGARVVKAFVRAKLRAGSRFGGANQHLTDDSIRAGRTVADDAGLHDVHAQRRASSAVLWFGGVRGEPGRAAAGAGDRLRQLPDDRAVLA
jgi:ATP-binding cassette subfamily B multidrug efflux pump